MAAYGCIKLVFSSSATVYGWPKELPCTGKFPLSTANPYGRTKLMIEEMCQSIYASDPEWKIVLLRLFNPVGTHPNGQIGVDPRGIRNNLMPFIQHVAVGRQLALQVFGNDYSTKDETAVCLAFQPCEVTEPKGGVHTFVVYVCHHLLETPKISAVDS